MNSWTKSFSRQKSIDRLLTVFDGSASRFSTFIGSWADQYADSSVSMPSPASSVTAVLTMDDGSSPLRGLSALARRR